MNWCQIRWLVMNSNTYMKQKPIIMETSKLVQVWHSACKLWYFLMHNCQFLFSSLCLCDYTDPLQASIVSLFTIQVVQ